MASTWRTGSAISKCVPSRASIASSIIACSRARIASTPSTPRPHPVSHPTALHRRPAGKDLLRLGALLGQDAAVLAPAPRVGLLQAAAGAQVRARPAARGDGIALPADGVRRPLRAGCVLVPQVVADR